jgi:predicted dehydrogenase
MAAKTIKIGIVGCGRVAENHAEAIKKCPNAKLVAAAGGRKSEEFASRHGLTLLKQEMICDSGLIDALLVLTPPQTHHDYATTALRAGKHVLVEKPVSFDIGEIHDMIRLAKEKRLVCMPGHSYIYLPELARMAKTIPNGGIGTANYLYIAETYYMPPELFSKYEGPEIDVLCHQLYLSLAFLGKPEKIAAFKTNFPVNMVPTGGPQVTVNMKYPGGALAQILVSWTAEDATADPWTFKIKALGTEGGMHFSRLDYVKHIHGNWEQMYYQEMFDCQMNHFVNHCILGGKAPLSTIEDAEMVCRMHALTLRAIKEEKIMSFPL